MPKHKRILMLAAAATLAGVCELRAQSPTYSELYNPLALKSLNLQMDPGDWAVVSADESRTIEKPAWFWADNESRMLVSVRRKGLEVTGSKFGIKIDFNDYFDANTWHGVKKISLEADASDVVSEGVAWFLHRQAATLPGDNYMPQLGSWANVTVNGDNIGVFAHVEQPDKRFL